MIWGGLHGIYLALERKIYKCWPSWNPHSRAMRWPRVFITFHLVCFAWIFFRAHGLDGVGHELSGSGQFSIAGFDADRHLHLFALLGVLAWAQFLSNNKVLKRPISESEGSLFIGTNHSIDAGGNLVHAERKLTFHLLSVLIVHKDAAIHTGTPISRQHRFALGSILVA